MSRGATSSEAPRVFPNTRWSVVLAAQQATPESAAALDSICRDYWYPLYAYVRRCGHSLTDAQDLTQEFFYRLLRKALAGMPPTAKKGRLRSFLIVALKKFMANEWRSRLGPAPRGRPGACAHRYGLCREPVRR